MELGWGLIRHRCIRRMDERLQSPGVEECNTLGKTGLFLGTASLGRNSFRQTTSLCFLCCMYVRFVDGLRARCFWPVDERYLRVDRGSWGFHRILWRWFLLD